MTRRGLLLAALAAAVFAAGCRVDMHDQPKYEPYEPSELFVSGTSAQAPPEGTVARDTLVPDEIQSGFTEADELVTEIPIPVDLATVRRGQTIYNGVCAPCHDRVGTGRGMIVRRGYLQPPSFHEERLRESPPGYFYDAITRGFGQMPSYAAQIDVEDRWAIVAYIQALQLSQGANVGELDEADRRAAATGGLEPATTGDARVPGAAAHGAGGGAPHGAAGRPTGPEPGSGTVGEVRNDAMNGSGETR